MMEKYFEKEKKDLKSSIIRKSILMAICGAVCTAYSCKAIECIIEKDVTQGIIFFMPVLLWLYLIGLEIAYIKKDIETSMDFLKDMTEIDNKMAEQKIKIDGLIKNLEEKINKKYELKEMVYQNERKTEVLAQGFHLGYAFYILNLGTHPTAYIEIPKEHVLYDCETCDEVPINVHGRNNIFDESFIYRRRSKNRRQVYRLGLCTRWRLYRVLWR